MIIAQVRNGGYEFVLDELITYVGRSRRWVESGDYVVAWSHKELESWVRWTRRE